VKVVKRKSPEVRKMRCVFMIIRCMNDQINGGDTSPSTVFRNSNALGRKSNVISVRFYGIRMG
jgi:hypothetical protein